VAGEHRWPADLPASLLRGDLDLGLSCALAGGEGRRSAAGCGLARTGEVELTELEHETLIVRSGTRYKELLLDV